ncbi:MAG: hypothetical protein ABIF10_02790 [Candidatus Woesearchaeota archaeon]
MVPIKEILDKYSIKLFLGEFNASPEMAVRIDGLASLLNDAEHTCTGNGCSEKLTPEIMGRIGQYAKLASKNADFARQYGPIVWELQEHFGLREKNHTGVLRYAPTGSSYPH